jgi:hypothetical protein
MNSGSNRDTVAWSPHFFFKFDTHRHVMHCTLLKSEQTNCIKYHFVDYVTVQYYNIVIQVHEIFRVQ